LEPDGNQEDIAHHERHAKLSRDATRVERETAIRLRGEGRINDEVLRRMERELDLADSRDS
jgi:monovalent cation/hydrogen antiporter